VNFRTDVALVHCFACSFSGTLLQYVELANQYKEGKLSGVIDNLRYLERNTPSDQIQAAIQRYEKKYAQAVEIEEKLETWNEMELLVFKRELKPSFLNKRGISVETAKDFGLLWDERSKRVVVPIRRYDGALVGCVGRCWCDQCKTGPRCDKPYYNYWAFKKSKFLFNEFMLKPKEPVYVVEGIFDAIRLVSFGFHNAAAILGSSLSVDQARKLAALSGPVYLMFDGDAAGRKCTMESIRILTKKVVVLYECAVPEDTDPGDLSKEQTENVIKSAKLVL
jgi:5S rRNA maturation endonuclease (ribonuclease M5)